MFKVKEVLATKKYVEYCPNVYPAYYDLSPAYRIFSIV